MPPPKRLKILEVIVSTLQDAIEAEHGGADRLEVVRDLEQGGLTPDLKLVEQIAAHVKLPLRVMLREQDSMSLLNREELAILCRSAIAFSRVGVDGLVIGFAENGELDMAPLLAIAQAVPETNLTFHRAFDVLTDPFLSIMALKKLPQVDRILTTGGLGSWPSRKSRLHQWQDYASPEITLIACAGLLESVLTDLQQDQHITEIHIGRAARIPQETSGQVSRIQVAQLKGRPA